MFKEIYSAICTGISSTVQHDIAHEAYAKGLISKVVHRTISDPLNRLTKDERTDIFMEELESKITNDPTALIQFVNVLKESDASYYKDLIRNISKSHSG